MRTVCAYSLWFSDPNAADSLWREVTAWVTHWYRSTFPEVDLPLGWEEGLADRLCPARDHGLETNIASLVGVAGRLRELRWRFPDADDPTVLRTIEATVLADAGTFVTLVVRIASSEFELAPARFQLRAPRLVRSLVARGDAHIGQHPIWLDPLPIDPNTVPRLTEALFAPSRRHPIVVVSPQPDDIYPLDPDAIAETLAGLAAVYVLTSRWSTFALTDEIGKRFSCYNGAVRIYWPRFSRDADPFAHPLWLPPQLHEFGEDDGFARFLLRMVAGVASFRFVEPEPLRTFRSRLDEARVAGIRAERTPDYEALFEEYVRLTAVARDLRGQRDAALAEIDALRGELSSHWVPSTQDRSKTRGAELDDRPEPLSVLEAVQAAQHRTSHIVFLEAAFESARESPFRQPDKVFSALLAVDDVARRWAAQLDGGPKLGARRDAFRQRGFEYKEDISPTAEGKWGDEYRYLYEGRRVVFAPHITIGAKSPDRCLSIHLHWDEHTRKAVVAHVGRHKTNTRS